MTHALNKAMPHAVMEEIPEDLDVFVARLLNYPAAIQSYQDTLHLKLSPDITFDRCQTWEKAGAIGNALIRGLCERAGKDDVSLKEKNDYYMQALKIAGILAIGFSRIADTDLPPDQEKKAFTLVQKYHPRFNGVYDMLADVYKIVLWNDNRLPVEEF